MANLAQTCTTNWMAALSQFNSDVIRIDFTVLGQQIANLIADVGQLHVVTKGDLHVFSAAEGGVPNNVNEAMRYGTKFFDAMYYFAIPVAARPATSAGVDDGANIASVILMAKKRLLWTAIFLMLRGSYPTAPGTTVGTDVPAFLALTCGMNESPAVVAAGLASFPLLNINSAWIRAIPWVGFAPEIRQRLALGLAGYRMLGPFKLYACRADAPAEVVEAFNWVRAVSVQVPDYAILSPTRSAVLISKLGSWNKALGNLMLCAFTPAQIQEMVANKILFAAPTRDPRADTWRNWVVGGPLVLNEPIGI